jgi:hypothetical protein
LKARPTALFVSGALWVVLLLVSCAGEPSIFFDIPEGDAADGLRAFAAQSSMEIIYNVDQVEGVTINRVYGNFTCREALELLLRNTSLEFTIDNASGAVALKKLPSSLTEN